MQPTHVYHCDWGTAADKRWLAQASLKWDGRYAAEVPRHVGGHTNLIALIHGDIGSQSCALAGFDFPIGIPVQYANAAGIKQFKSFLTELGSGRWPDFFNCAKDPAEISVRRPFFPLKPGGTRQAQLLHALGVQNIGELHRRCERKQTGRRAACPLFWTLGANQVGKGAIVGWRDVLAPALNNDNDVFLWPFDGQL